MNIDNILGKLQCPKCGGTRNMRVGVTAMAHIENGSLYQYEHVNVRPSHEVRCNGCRYTSTAEEFMETFAQANAGGARDVGDALLRV